MVTIKLITSGFLKLSQFTFKQSKCTTSNTDTFLFDKEI